MQNHHFRAAALAIAAIALLTGPAVHALSADEIDAVARHATRGVKRVVRTLASDGLRGRDNDTPESLVAQRYLIGHLKGLGVGLNAAARGAQAYRQPFVQRDDTGTNLFPGTNLLALIRGRDLPDEYVIVGAHYDHLDSRSDATGHCASRRAPGGAVCNGATDNAAGVAAVLAVGKGLRALPEPPRRSVVLALWDAEEDGLLGSKYYVEHPLVPLGQTVAYVNFDILGADLLPSLRSTTFAVGSETGGATLRSIVDGAVAAQSLQVRPFSFIFGQLRSDYANFGNHSIPTVFFSDSTGGCYHTTGDDVSLVNFPKLAQQSAIAFRTVVGLAQAADRPVYVAAPLTVFEDAVSLQQTLATAIPADLDQFSAEQQTLALSTKAQIDQIVADGATQFDDDDIGVVLNAAVTLIDALTESGCRPF